MAITWGAYRDQIRRSILRENESNNWTDEQIYDYVRWALDRFAIHTAHPKEVVIEEDSENGYDFTTDTRFELPDDIFESLEVSSRIHVLDVKQKRTYLDPIDKTPGLHPYHPSEPSFWVWPEGYLNVNPAPGAGSQIHIEYFAYYPLPAIEDEEGVIPIPRWAEKPIATLVGAYSLESLANESANIDRWKDNTDSGNPEHNALRSQQSYLIKLYEQQLLQFTPQDRVNYFREYGRVERSY